jgi:murein DD-endopeptidase MepM/ murein hydrolase activator NlpD
MRSSNSGLSAFFLLFLASVIFGGALWMNASNSTPISPVLPTENQPTEESLSISQLMDRNFGREATALPTVDIPQVQATRPVVAQPAGPTATPISAVDASNQSQNQNAALVGATPTLPPATVNAPLQSGTTDPEDWNPPALIPPISRDPEGRDHYWFYRPINSDANSRILLSYSYGTGGVFSSRIHHGVDMPNHTGEVILAAAPGTIIFASSNTGGDAIDIFQNTTAYGNAVFIRHDFGYQGQAVYSLYAHMLRTIVSEGDYVDAGDPIGLVGNTGLTTGPHVHFEVRIGGDRYGNSYNPILWMVPYVDHGIIAGRVLDANGEFVNDVTVTFRSRAIGTVIGSIHTYTFQNTVDDVNPDPKWNENFAISDIPVGRYDVIVTIDGLRVVRQIEVFEGMTSFVELKPPEPEATEENTKTN